MHLEQQEKFAEIQRQARESKLQLDRMKLIEPFIEFYIPGLNLGQIDDEVFNGYGYVQ